MAQGRPCHGRVHLCRCDTHIGPHKQTGFIIDDAAIEAMIGVTSALLEEVEPDLVD